MYEKKNDYIIVAIVLFICIAAGWLYADSHRNDRIHNSTDNTVTEMEERINNLADGLDRVQERVAESQKTVTGIAESVADSRRKAESIAKSIDRTEARLDEAIQRSGKLANELADLEAEHQKRKSRTQTADMAK